MSTMDTGGSLRERIAERRAALAQTAGAAPESALRDRIAARRAALGGTAQPAARQTPGTLTGSVSGYEQPTGAGAFQRPAMAQPEPSQGMVENFGIGLAQRLPIAAADVLNLVRGGFEASNDPAAAVLPAVGNTLDMVSPGLQGAGGDLANQAVGQMAAPPRSPMLNAVSGALGERTDVLRTIGNAPVAAYDAATGGTPSPFSGAGIARAAGGTIIDMGASMGGGFVGGVVGGPAGAAAGAFAPNMLSQWASGMAETANRIMEANPDMDQREALARAFGVSGTAAVPAAMLDSLTGAESAVAKVGTNTLGGGLRRTALNVGRSALEEGLTEPGQSVIQDVGSLAAQPIRGQLPNDAVSQYGQQRAAEALIGGLMGGAGGGASVVMDRMGGSNGRNGDPTQGRNVAGRGPVGRAPSGVESPAVQQAPVRPLANSVPPMVGNDGAPAGTQPGDVAGERSVPLMADLAGDWERQAQADAERDAAYTERLWDELAPQEQVAAEKADPSVMPGATGQVAPPLPGVEEAPAEVVADEVTTPSGRQLSPDGMSNLRRKMIARREMLRASSQARQMQAEQDATIGRQVAPVDRSAADAIAEGYDLVGDDNKMVSTTPETRPISPETSREVMDEQKKQDTIQLLEDFIRTKKEQRQDVPQQWYKRLSELKGAGPSEVVGMAVFGHPEATNIGGYKYANLIPFKTQDVKSIRNRIGSMQAFVDELQSRIVRRKGVKPLTTEEETVLELLKTETAPELYRMLRVLEDNEAKAPPSPNQSAISPQTSREEATAEDQPKYIRPSDLSGDMQMFAKHKDAAWKQVKALRQKVKDLGPRAGNVRLELLKAERKHHEFVQWEKDARDGAERRAQELGKTTKKAKPTPSSPGIPDNSPNSPAIPDSSAKAAKEPWEMTRGDYAERQAAIPASGGFAANSNRKIAKAMHRKYVGDAVAEGKPVPASVLADYPDLASSKATLDNSPNSKATLTSSPKTELPPVASMDRAALLAELGEKVTGTVKKLRETVEARRRQTQTPSAPAVASTTSSTPQADAKPARTSRVRQEKNKGAEAATAPDTRESESPSPKGTAPTEPVKKASTSPESEDNGRKQAAKTPVDQDANPREQPAGTDVRTWDAIDTAVERAAKGIKAAKAARERFNTVSITTPDGFVERDKLNEAIATAKKTLSWAELAQTKAKELRAIIEADGPHDAAWAVSLVKAWDASADALAIDALPVSAMRTIREAQRSLLERVDLDTMPDTQVFTFSEPYSGKTRKQQEKALADVVAKMAKEDKAVASERKRLDAGGIYVDERGKIGTKPKFDEQTRDPFERNKLAEYKDDKARLKGLAEATSKETTRYAINGLHISRDGKTAVVTDGRRLWAHTRKAGWGVKSGVYLDGGGNDVAKGVLSNPSEEAKFPPYEEIFLDKGRATMVGEANPALLANYARRAEIFTGDPKYDYSVGVLLTRRTDRDGKYEFGIVAQSPAHGEAHIGPKGTEAIAYLKPDFLAEALEWHAKNGSVAVTIYQDKVTGPLQIEGADGTISVTMPVNLDDGTRTKAQLNAAAAESGAIAPTLAEKAEAWADATEKDARAKLRDKAKKQKGKMSSGIDPIEQAETAYQIGRWAAALVVRGGVKVAQAVYQIVGKVGPVQLRTRRAAEAITNQIVEAAGENPTEAALTIAAGDVEARHLDAQAATAERLAKAAETEIAAGTDPQGRAKVAAEYRAQAAQLREQADAVRKSPKPEAKPREAKPDTRPASVKVSRQRAVLNVAAIVAFDAGKALKAGTKVGNKRLGAMVDKALVRVPWMKGDREAIVRSARAILKDAGKDPAKIEAAHAAAAEELSKRATAIREAKRARGALVADMFKDSPDKRISGKQAMKERMREVGKTVGKMATAAGRTVIKAIRQTKQAGRAEAAAKIADLRERIKGERKRQADMRRIETRGAVDAAKDAARDQAAMQQGYKDQLVRLIRENMPRELRGKYLTAVRDVKTLARLGIEAGKLERDLLEHMARTQIRQAEKAAGTVSTRMELEPELREQLNAAVGQLQTLKRRLRTLGSGGSLTAAVGSTANASTQRVTADDLRVLLDDIENAARAILSARFQQKNLDMVRIKGELVAAKEIREGMGTVLEAAADLPRSGTKTVEAGWLLRKLRRRTNWDSMMQMLDGGLRSGPFRRLFGEVEKGRNAALELHHEFQDLMGGIVQKHGYDSAPKMLAEVSGSLGENLQKTVRANIGGEPTTMTLGQAMYLYASSEDTGFLARIRKGQKIQFKTQRTSDPISITEDDLASVAKALTPEQRAMVDELKAAYDRHYFQKLSTVNKRLKGVFLEKVPGYWGIKLNRDFSEMRGTPTTWRGNYIAAMEEAGYMQERLGPSKTPILIGDFGMDILTRSKSASTTIGKAERVKLLMQTLMHPDVVKTITDKYGAETIERLKRRVAEWSGGTTYSPIGRVWRELLSMWARAKTQLRFPTWMRNAVGGSSRMINELGMKDVAATAFRPSVAAYRELMRYSPAARERWAGGSAGNFYDTINDDFADAAFKDAGTATIRNMAGIAKAAVTLDKDAATASAAGAWKSWRKTLDAITVGNYFDAHGAVVAYNVFLSKAPKEWSESKRKTWAARKAMRAFERTGNTAILEYANDVQLDARDNMWIGMMTTFTGDTAKAMNMVYQAYGRAQAGEISWGKAFKTIGVLLFGSALSGLVSAAWAAMLGKGYDKAKSAAGSRFIQEVGSLVPMGGGVVTSAIMKAINRHNLPADSVLDVPMMDLIDAGARMSYELAKSLDAPTRKVRKNTVTASERYVRALMASSRLADAVGLPSQYVFDAKVAIDNWGK